jgi:sulfopropanediol 3-dehydrogenase
MLQDLEKNGMDAVRRYREQFDGGAGVLSLKRRTDRSCRRRSTRTGHSGHGLQPEERAPLAEAQLTTMLPLEVNIRPGVTLGHKHIPVGAVGSYIPGGRYPMFGSAKMSYQIRDYHIDYDIFCEIYDPNRNGRLGTCMESRAAPSGGGAV